MGIHREQLGGSTSTNSGGNGKTRRKVRQVSPFKDFTVCKAVELNPLKPRNDKGCWRKPKSTELEWREDLTSSHSAASSFSSCSSFSLPPPAPPAFTPALLRTIEKQPSMRLGESLVCLPAHICLALTLLDGKQITATPFPVPVPRELRPHLLPGACLQHGAVRYKEKIFRDPHPIWRAKRVNGNNC